MVVFLILVIVAFVLGIVGAAVDGLGYLVFVGVVVLAVTLAVAARRWSSRGHERHLR
ncbi:hypothetical protein [Streptomyces antarcticus]|uniref:hypothetical protein n=1 Tax=Streptomyces antarcticus TaxID=2996458 RepID=UPI0022706712|nr:MULTISPECIES: hypothetical protein [unclassified Streptomyces]MCY0940497.1 hypothetical protein [Streptomyces sp. H34-AA3]MCZ4082384.1 hypothetical protein [Streptomyces sp. H34-S5]